jgi:hypothetical protein
MAELNEAEKAALKRLLDDYGERLGNAGCNDFDVPNTPENLAMVAAAQYDPANHTEDNEPNVDGDRIYTTDFVILDHLVKRLGLEDAHE